MSAQNSPLRLVETKPTPCQTQFPNDVLMHLNHEILHVYGALQAIFKLTLAAENEKIEAIHIATLLNPQKNRLWDAAKALENLAQISGKQSD